jgi:hypothetical protein
MGSGVYGRRSARELLAPEIKKKLVQPLDLVMGSGVYGRRSARELLAPVYG